MSYSFACSIDSADMTMRLEDEFARMGNENLFQRLCRSHASKSYALYECLGRNQLPNDPEVNESFGFDRFPHPKDKRMLLGLYQELALLLVDLTEMDQWRAKAELLERIKREFMQRPAHLRGEHFAWLLENEDVFREVDREQRARPEERQVCRFIPKVSSANLL